jgi:hypothetical protein
MAISLLLCTCFLAALANTGQEATKQTHSFLVTGCLKRGEVADRFHLIGRDGKAYALRSTSLKLADHVGQNVTIKGVLEHDAKRDDYDFEGSEVNEEYGKGKVAEFVDIEVIDLKMVARSCR